MKCTYIIALLVAALAVASATDAPTAATMSPTATKSPTAAPTAAPAVDKYVVELFENGTCSTTESGAEVMAPAMEVGAACSEVKTTFGNLTTAASVWMSPAKFSPTSNSTIHMTMGISNETCAATEVACVIDACCDAVTIGEAKFQYRIVKDTDSASSMTSFTMLSALFAVVAALFAF